jgi:hypothetical protein
MALSQLDSNPLTGKTMDLTDVRINILIRRCANATIVSENATCHLITT